MSKEIIEFKKMHGAYEVKRLTNRLEPEVGTFLAEREVEQYIMQANRLSSKLTVKIS